ncbi:UNKNOWN [Stylonychia lemnae]|uniref:Uncharacterized protein n=1 Tax=Stylonychia lemnae TaxID=5949 RepID=A0A078ASC7_STYLE|nr:UNKNOWN [Stylonychia lemnae]|eukprot:CDW84132.1 UNKNOWN [Stylonychia lemnae]
MQTYQPQEQFSEEEILILNHFKQQIKQALDYKKSLDDKIALQITNNQEKEKNDLIAINQLNQEIQQLNVQLEQKQGVKRVKDQKFQNACQAWQNLKLARQKVQQEIFQSLRIQQDNAALQTRNLSIFQEKDLFKGEDNQYQEFIKMKDVSKKQQLIQNLFAKKLNVLKVKIQLAEKRQNLLVAYKKRLQTKSSKLADISNIKKDLMKFQLEIKEVNFQFYDDLPAVYQQDLRNVKSIEIRNYDILKKCQALDQNINEQQIMVQQHSLKQDMYQEQCDKIQLESNINKERLTQLEALEGQAKIAMEKAKMYQSALAVKAKEIARKEDKKDEILAKQSGKKVNLDQLEQSYMVLIQGKLYEIDKLCNQQFEMDLNQEQQIQQYEKMIELKESERIINSDQLAIDSTLEGRLQQQLQQKKKEGQITLEKSNQVRADYQIYQANLNSKKQMIWGLNAIVYSLIGVFLILTLYTRGQHQKNQLN